MQTCIATPSFFSLKIREFERLEFSGSFVVLGRVKALQGCFRGYISDVIYLAIRVLYHTKVYIWIRIENMALL